MPGQAASQEKVAKGEVELGLYNVSEIPEGKGLKLAGPVPPPLQINTTYEGALMSDGSVPEAARAFIRFLAEPERAPSGSRRSSSRCLIASRPIPKFVRTLAARPDTNLGIKRTTSNFIILVRFWI